MEHHALREQPIRNRPRLVAILADDGHFPRERIEFRALRWSCRSRRRRWLLALAWVRLLLAPLQVSPQPQAGAGLGALLARRRLGVPPPVLAQAPPPALARLCAAATAAAAARIGCLGWSGACAAFRAAARAPVCESATVGRRGTSRRDATCGRARAARLRSPRWPGRGCSNLRDIPRRTLHGRKSRRIRCTSTARCNRCPVRSRDWSRRRAPTALRPRKWPCSDIPARTLRN